MDAALVECHSGFTYAERPTALYWQGQRLEVEEILSSWRGTGGRGFRVETVDHQIFDLFYNEQKDNWHITDF